MKKSVLTLALATVLACLPVDAQAQTLKILHTNDTHSQIYPGSDGLGGIARRKVLIDSVRMANDNVLLIDCGDIVQGTLYFNVFQGELEEKLMDYLKYDIRILGNHEFDNGMEKLAENLKTAHSILGIANYKTEKTPLAQLDMSPYIVTMVSDNDPEAPVKTVGFVPINLDPKGMISDSNVVGLEYLDGVETANHLSWVLKNIYDVDYVVALTHIGYEADTALIAQSHDIDLVIGGHSHTKIDPNDPKSVPHIVKNADGRDVVVAQTGNKGRYLGEITIDLGTPGKLAQTKLIPVDSRLDDRLDPKIETIIAPYQVDVDVLFTENIARASRDLPNDEPGLLNFAADFVMERGRQLAKPLGINVDMAIVNKGGLRISLKKGSVSKGDIMTMMPFDNRVQVIEITGKQLTEAFDVMARAKGNGVSYNVEAVYDPTTGKCTKVLVNGQPIDPEKVYHIATIDYLANGGDYFASLVDHKTLAESHQIMSGDLIDMLVSGPWKNKKINPSDTPRMRAR